MNGYLDFLYDVLMQDRRLQSDFIRANAFYAAEAASRGDITSLVKGVATKKWHLTADGYQKLKEAGYI